MVFVSSSIHFGAPAAPVWRLPARTHCWCGQSRSSSWSDTLRSRTSLFVPGLVVAAACITGRLARRRPVLKRASDFRAEHRGLHLMGCGASHSSEMNTQASPEAMERLKGLKSAATSSLPFSDSELESAVSSMRKAAGSHQEVLDWAALQSCLATAAHEPYKDWPKTAASASELSDRFLKPSSPEFWHVFRRVREDGCWDAAVKAAAARTAGVKPWVVLVTGLNGIRKTTCMYQPWFKDVLHAALRQAHGDDTPAVDELPDGTCSFFRQLDHIIATIANDEFRTLYNVSDVDEYSALKDGIFARYRKIAEMWGVTLMTEAKSNGINVMAETSGRDAGMWHYIDFCFPDDSYRKLVLHFEINDISFAERSVDSRMSREIQAGHNALAGAAADIINVNSGGPYGSKVLKGVQADSDKVWRTVVDGELAKTWYKASLSITARDDGEWTCTATGMPDAGAHPIQRL
eukprot:TRINITY_DN11694_c0_g1_i10.p1 TRINITY_DN11694_c0_g1~~TRINITY_DN11694_c0_g1_i10.p1  ORF type:complete len:462 (-),score=68.41 TRINITY_DN11694_c0_g1_i10:132-1517(-)